MELDIEEIFEEKKEAMLAEIGGVDGWMRFSVEERLRLGKKLVRDAEIFLGERVLERLPPEQRQEAAGCFWSGCSMHKDLNAVKEGAGRMLLWWEKSGSVPLVTLANKVRVEAGSDCEVRQSDVRATHTRQLLVSKFLLLPAA